MGMWNRWKAQQYRPDIEHFRRGAVLRYPNLMRCLVLILIFSAACEGSSGGSPTASNSPNTADNTLERFTVNQITVDSGCAITPRARNMEIVQESDPSSIIIGILPQNNQVQVSQRSEDGMYQIHLPGTPVDNGWIAARGVTTQGGCACGPRCLEFNEIVVDPPITDCEVAFTPDDFITIYHIPQDSASVFGVSTAGDDAAGLAQAITEDGWIGFDPRVESSESGVSRLRWIRSSDTSVSLSGTQCIDLPTYTYVLSGE